MQANAIVSLMFYFIIPLWMLAGVADWVCHRVSDIQHTTGAKESIIHLLMFAEAGTALIAGLFLEINALIIALIIAMFVLHEATGWWDIGYASTRREITHYEQHAHSFLEVVPLMAALLVIVLHWGAIPGAVRGRAGRGRVFAPMEGPAAASGVQRRHDGGGAHFRDRAL